MAIIVFLIYSIFFVFFQTGTVYGGDGGDFVSAALSGGFAHAPGYPLYSIMGYILTKLPISTPAWRVTLLSSIPAAATLTLVYLFIWRVSKKTFPGLIASAILGSTYVFWLYSVVPEVFILNIFFTILILYLLLLWSEKGDQKLLLSALFVFSLSLSHHHIVLFMLPAFSVFLILNKKKLPIFNRGNIISFIIVGLLGILPYIWLPFTAIIIPKYYWGDPDSPIRFLNVVTRAYYGTFIAAQDYNQTIMTRLQQIPTLFGFYMDDFLIISLIIAVLGCIYLFKKNRVTFTSLIIGFLLTGPAYFMYASYDYSTPYRAAVAERFLLPSYLLLALFIGFGLVLIQEKLTQYLSSVSQKKLVVYLPLLFFVLIPLYILSTNYYRVGILKGDRTAEYFAEDILATKTPDKKAIFLLQNDNSIFDTQYLHLYHPEQYQDAIPLNPAELANGFSHKMIKKYYPGIQLPAYDKYHPIADFILKNYDNYEIYTDIHEEYDSLEGIKDGEWVPYGLLFRYYKKDDIPDAKLTAQKNDELWNSYHNPLAGSLKNYRNLQLAHVLEFYQFGRVRTGIYDLEHGLNEDALVHLKAYEDLAPEFQMKLAQVALGAAYLNLKECDKAKPVVKGIDDFETDKYYLLMIQYNTVCTKDESAISYWKSELEKFRKGNERGLEEL